ncbi:MAG: hypothetical protein E3J78_08505 [Candidatus Cloacimonadota bacterium]|nr:MAG: hypothetical protein E3J78_08505 [Candidatus Cloacimonadota bacterium]
MIVFDYLLNALTNTLKSILLFLPVIASCTIIEILSTVANRGFARRFGWCGVLPLAIIGTPIHELSHAIVALLTGHRIQELVLFRPNFLTGELGHVKHSWNEKNPFHRYISNPLIAIAPFFGGSIILFLLTKLLMPQLIKSNTLPLFSSGIITNVAQFKMYVTGLLIRTGTMLNVFFSWRNFLNFRFYLFVPLAFGISLHLSPSRQDFAHFWSSIFGVLFFLFILNLVFPQFVGFLEINLVPFLLNLHPLLSLSAFFCLIAVLFSLILFFL